MDVSDDCAFKGGDIVHDSWHERSAYIKTGLGKVYLFNLLSVDTVAEIDKTFSKEYYRDLAKLTSDEHKAEEEARAQGTVVKVTNEVMLASAKKRKRAAPKTAPAVLESAPKPEDAE